MEILPPPVLANIFLKLHQTGGLASLGPLLLVSRSFFQIGNNVIQEIMATSGAPPPPAPQAPAPAPASSVLNLSTTTASFHDETSFLLHREGSVVLPSSGRHKKRNSRPSNKRRARAAALSITVGAGGPSAAGMSASPYAALLDDAAPAALDVLFASSRVTRLRFYAHGIALSVWAVLLMPALFMVILRLQQPSGEGSLPWSVALVPLHLAALALGVYALLAYTAHLRSARDAHLRQYLVIASAPGGCPTEGEQAAVLAELRGAARVLAGADPFMLDTAPGGSCCHNACCRCWGECCALACCDDQMGRAYQAYLQVRPGLSPTHPTRTPRSGPEMPPAMTAPILVARDPGLAADAIDGAGAASINWDRSIQAEARAPLPNALGGPRSCCCCCCPGLPPSTRALGLAVSWPLAAVLTGILVGLRMDGVLPVGPPAAPALPPPQVPYLALLSPAALATAALALCMAPLRDALAQGDRGLPVRLSLGAFLVSAPITAAAAMWTLGARLDGFIPGWVSWWVVLAPLLALCALPFLCALLGWAAFGCSSFLMLALALPLGAAAILGAIRLQDGIDIPPGLVVAPLALYVVLALAQGLSNLVKLSREHERVLCEEVCRAAVGAGGGESTPAMSSSGRESFWGRTPPATPRTPPDIEWGDGIRPPPSLGPKAAALLGLTPPLGPSALASPPSAVLLAAGPPSGAPGSGPVIREVACAASPPPTTPSAPSPSHPSPMLEQFVASKATEVPSGLEELLHEVSQHGVCCYPWANLKFLIRTKLTQVLDQMHRSINNDILDRPPSGPGFEELKTTLLSQFDGFSEAPFTLQRMCELLTIGGQSHFPYQSTRKFLNAFDKLVTVTTTIPFQAVTKRPRIEPKAADLERMAAEDAQKMAAAVAAAAHMKPEEDEFPNIEAAPVAAAALPIETPAPSAAATVGSAPGAAAEQQPAPVPAAALPPASASADIEPATPSPDTAPQPAEEAPTAPMEVETPPASATATAGAPAANVSAPAGSENTQAPAVSPPRDSGCPVPPDPTAVPAPAPVPASASASASASAPTSASADLAPHPAASTPAPSSALPSDAASPSIPALTALPSTISTSSPTAESHAEPVTVPPAAPPASS
ncbi:putative serine/threonine-protein phosphatase 4 regulatory subunit 2 [Paratrimastix pyriformis]|uniref:Serine/threonine-protein phosphatase 4 regulatory subunit 2 n=1 Tax=Paratrimastix pyriformis TaxID=342808 RepID=A0ABQ8UD30_9EUKA|nr:putative serine/threonine-protein phosphatase 4 regulatory subunit 2 [Paratrimastix pyriformis]